MRNRWTTVVAAAVLVVVSGCRKAEPAAGASAGPPREGGLPSQAPSASANVLPPSGGQLPPPAAPPLVAYLDGLDALTQGHWPDAATAFSRALDASGDDPTFVLARGVAETLAEQFQPALNDLARAKRLGLKGREAELWTYAAEAMSGIVSPEHALGGGPRSLQGQGGPPPLVSIPGHIAQGGQDYSTVYGTIVAYELANAYQRLRLPVDYGGTGTPDAVKGPAMRAAMLKAGQAFANRATRRADLAPAHAARAKTLHDSGQYEAALREIDLARTAYPDNADLVYLSANCWLALGRPATARREYTLALTSRTDFAPGYLGRAAAAARMGDRARMTADLATAARLDSAATSRARGAIEADLSRQHVDGDAARAWADLDAAAQRGDSADQLAAIATRIHKIAGGQRLRYDEIYQDTVRTLEDAVRANPRQPDRYADLARYLVTEADNRGEAVEPRRETVEYRAQTSREQELTRAIQIADQALAINAKHAGALIQKAMALTALKRYDQAEAIADQALAAAGNNPDALRLYAKFRAMRANQMSAEASSLRQDRCSSSSHDEDHGDYTDHITTTTCYPPSQADLARAAQLDATAAELRRRARSAMERAMQVSKGTVAGFLIEADLHLWDGDLPGAQAALQQAVKLDPKSLEAQDELVDFYASTGQRDLAEEQQAIERQLINTTAAPLLRLAWTRIAKTAWSGATGYLTRARQLDPEDARVPAYLAVTLDQQGKTAEAATAFREAIALEDARLRLDEPDNRQGAPLTRDPIDFGLIMRARMRLAAPLERANQSAAAVDLYLANAAVRTRVSRSDYSRQMFTAMFPDDQPTNGAVVPAPVNAATMLAQSSLAAGKALRALGRKDEAQQQFLAAASFVPAPGAMIPRIGNARGDTNFGDQATAGSGEALVELAKTFLEAGQVDQAQRYLQAATNAGIPDSLRNDVNQMNFAIARMMSNRQQSQPQAYESPQEQPFRQMQQQQDRARAQALYQYMSANARVVPDIVGTWELTPENAFLPMKKTLTVDSSANYTLVMQSDGRTSRGKANSQRGQLMLFGDDGSSDTLYFEPVSRDQLSVTALDGTKYVARRRP
ncbi:MAG TPA: tetratricopeptide repeat protein [Vicinamibacterales bacterium]|nr:tetratricopeptide repeat protein [Vicinamibacterales bacterium]